MQTTITEDTLPGVSPGARAVRTDSYFFDDFGFLHVDAVLSHEGTLQYFDEEKKEWIGAYMPVESLKQLVSDCTGSIVTSEHPVKDDINVLVDNDNFKNVAVGYLKNNDLKVEGNNLIGSLVVADSDAIKSVLSGNKKGISLGYTEYKFPVKGIDSQGTPYESIKKGLKLNHIALVEKPRAPNALISLDSLRTTYGLEETSRTAHGLEETSSPVSSSPVSSPNYTSSIPEDYMHGSSEDLSKVQMSRHGQLRMDKLDFPTLLEHKKMTEETNDKASVELTNQLLQKQSDLIKLQASYDSLKVELETAKTKNQDLNNKLEAANSATQGATAALDSYKEQAPTQFAIDAIVAERVAAWAKVGDKVAFDSTMSALDIQRARLSADFPQRAEQFKTASADYLDAFESAFDSLQASNPQAPKPLFDSVESTKETKKRDRANAFVMDADGTYSLFNLKKQPRKGY
ncbi:MAG: hypothetical protein RLZZ171_981 [Cyanobacteriota bacterium]|jgi:uncharacterized protein